MDLTPTDEQEAFRAECRAWLVEHLPWEYGVGLPPVRDDLARALVEVAWIRSQGGAEAEELDEALYDLDGFVLGEGDE